MGAFGEGIGPDTDDGIRLCELLGLDPAEVTDIRIVLEAGAGTVIEWSGKRRVPMRAVVDALADALDPGTRPDGPSWTPPADPWGTPPEAPC